MSVHTSHHRHRRADAHRPHAEGRRQHHPMTLEQDYTRLDAAIEVLLMAMLAFMPLAFGAVEAWSELIILVAGLALAALVALRPLVHRRTGMAWTWAYLPMALFIGLIAIQLIPLPAGLVRAISGNTAETRARLLADSGGEPAAMTLSFYPLATAHNLRLILVVCAVFFAVVNVIRRQDQIKRLLGAVAAIGAAVTLIALAQTVTGTDRIYWTIPTGSRYADAGPFINHSHFGQFLNLAMGAAFGLVLILLHEGFRGVPWSTPEVMDRLWHRRLRPFWALVAMIVLGITGVFTSLTRGGMITLLLAASLTTVLLSSKRGLRGTRWIMALMALGSFVVVLYVGFDAVYERLATLREVDKAQGGRLQILEDIALAWTQFPLVGTGLGTHEVVYPMFEHSNHTHLAGHAENEYAQLAEETGLIGLACMAGFALLIWRHYARCIRSLRPHIRLAAFGLGFGFLAVMLHSLSDFGQHIPAVACLTAVTAGLLVVLGQTRPASQATDEGSTPAAQEMDGWQTSDPAPAADAGASLPTPEPIENPPPKPSTAACRSQDGSAALCHRLPALVVLLLVAIAGVWAVPAALRAHTAESHWRIVARVESQLRESDWLGSNEQYAKILDHAAEAVAAEPASVQYRYWLNVYRWRALSRVIDPQTGRIVLTPESLAHTGRIVRELHAARPLCPSFGPIYALAGQLELFILDDPAGAAHIRLGVQLAPNDATAWYTAGLLAVEEQKLEVMERAFHRALELDESLYTAVAETCLGELNRPDLALSLAGDSIPRLLQAAALLEAAADDVSPATQHAAPSTQDASVAPPARDSSPVVTQPAPSTQDSALSTQDSLSSARLRLFETLQARCRASDAPAVMLALLAEQYVQRSDDGSAIECYRRALALDYAQVSWRLALARALARVSETEEAIRQARICLRLRPEHPAAKQLIEDLATSPPSPPHGRQAPAARVMKSPAPAVTSRLKPALINIEEGTESAADVHHLKVVAETGRLKPTQPLPWQVAVGDGHHGRSRSVTGTMTGRGRFQAWAWIGFSLPVVRGRVGGRLQLTGTPRQGRGSASAHRTQAQDGGRLQLTRSKPRMGSASADRQLPPPSGGGGRSLLDLLSPFS